MCRYIWSSWGMFVFSLFTNIFVPNLPVLVYIIMPWWIYNDFHFSHFLLSWKHCTSCIPYSQAEHLKFLAYVHHIWLISWCTFPVNTCHYGMTVLETECVQASGLWLRSHCTQSSMMAIVVEYLFVWYVKKSTLNVLWRENYFAEHI